MKVNVCLMQESPIFFEKEKTIAKVKELVIKYAARGSQLIVFPESFIPGYPRGLTFGNTVGNRTDDGRKMYAEFYNSSFDINSGDLKTLEELSKSQNVYLVIGVTEKQNSNGSLYCSMLYISPTSGLLGVHRKIKPTGSERLIWAESDGKDLVSFDTPIGKLGGLICWENYMPLARASMYKQGVQIYIAPTADQRETWTSTMRHIALEGRCFVLGCNQYFEKSMYPDKYRSFVGNEPEIICRGGSIIVAPSGKVIAGPLFDQAGALQAEIDLDDIILSKLDFDPVGHYSRDDIFEFNVLNQPSIKKE